MAWRRCMRMQALHRGDPWWSGPAHPPADSACRSLARASSRPARTPCPPTGTAAVNTYVCSSTPHKDRHVSQSHLPCYMDINRRYTAPPPCVCVYVCVNNQHARTSPCVSSSTVSVLAASSCSCGTHTVYTVCGAAGALPRCDRQAGLGGQTDPRPARLPSPAHGSVLDHHQPPCAQRSVTATPRHVMQPGPRRLVARSWGHVWSLPGRRMSSWAPACMQACMRAAPG